jgi:glycosyltransferase involved in cell wall biosynthesis
MNADASNLVTVCHFQRKPRAAGNFSIEAIFLDVRHRLESAISIRLWVAPCLSNGFLRRCWIALNALQNQCDVNHVTGDINFVSLALNGRKTVLTILDCGDLCSRRDLRAKLLRKLWVEWPVRHVAKVTTISSSAKADILSLIRCDTSKVEVIPVAIADSFEWSERSPSFEAPRILHVGTASNKNLSRLIQAVRGLNCTLVIVGVLSEAVLAELNAIKVCFENHVNLSQPELIEQYVQADMLAFVSTYEGFGMPILEAQTVGRPVLTSNISSMPEVAGDAACLVDPFDVASIRDGILRIIDDAAYRTDLIARGVINAKRFDANVIANQYLAVYHAVAANNR